MAINTQQFEARKRDHIRHALDPANQALGQTKFDEIHLFHDALPDLDFEDIHLETPGFGLGKNPLATPFYIPGMTAGHADAPLLNRTLALACERRGWAMGVGSQRRELGEHAGDRVDAWKELRAQVPELVLIANIGISQAIRVGSDQVQALADSLGAQAIAIHLNALQEALQPEGTPQFRGSFDAIRRLCSELKTPVLLKETGCGFSRSTLARLASLCQPRQGVVAIDLSGKGGTHWGRMEGARAPEGSLQARGAVTFGNWGESIVDSLHAARDVFKTVSTRPEIWASGGMRSGLDAAKAIALGATRVGLAKPALEAALQGEQALDAWMAQIEYELKVALFCTGCRDPKTLREKEEAWKASAI
jgi:isopentenyl-diphosphate delta-isomerase